MIFFLNESAYTTMVQLATSLYLIPYLFGALYLIFLATHGEGIRHPEAGRSINLDGPTVGRRTNRLHLLIAVVAFIYSVWLFYAADPKFVLLGMLLVVPGMIVYAITQIQGGRRVFNAFEWFVAAVVVAAAVTAVVLWTQGAIDLS